MEGRVQKCSCRVAFRVACHDGDTSVSGDADRDVQGDPAQDIAVQGGSQLIATARAEYR
jgi:hypothetical protein